MIPVKYNTIKSYYAKSANDGKERMKQNFVLEDARFKQNIQFLIRSDRKCFETFKFYTKTY